MGGDPLAGLAVERVTETAQAAQGIEDEILCYLAEHGPYVGGADTLATAMSRRAAQVRDGVRTLIAAGRITRSGSGPSTRIEVRL